MMQLKGIIVIALIFTGLGLNNIQAQSMYVKEISGTQTEYLISSISKISFSSGNLTISHTNNTSDVYALGALRYLNFSDSTAVNIDHESTAEHEIKIYPNPVKDELKIDLSNSSSTDWRFYIIDFQGKVLKTQSVSGSDLITVDMSPFPAGTYICHFINEAKTESFKLIKQ